MSQNPGEVTRLLQQWRTGDRQAEQKLFQLILPDLRQIASGRLARERPDHTLEPNELVNQTYLRLVNDRERDWQNRNHFFAVAARAMRRYLIDYANAKSSRRVVSIEALPGLDLSEPVDLEMAVQLDRLLDELESVNTRWCSIAEMKCFLGLTDEEASEATGIPLRSLQRQWSDTRRWLFERLHKSAS
jgi:RNA polymerase sigma factor (TIGR02999 family)